MTFLCVDCVEKPRKSVWHTVSGCCNSAQVEHKKRYDKVAFRVHLELSKRYDLECGEEWYEHKSLPLIENDQVKLAWDSTVVTDRRVSHSRPDVTIILEDKHQWLMADIAVSDDRNIVKYGGYTS